MRCRPNPSNDCVDECTVCNETGEEGREEGEEEEKPIGNRGEREAAALAEAVRVLAGEVGAPASKTPPACTATSLPPRARNEMLLGRCERGLSSPPRIHGSSSISASVARPSGSRVRMRDSSRWPPVDTWDGRVYSPESILKNSFDTSGSSKGRDPHSSTYRMTPQDHTSAA